MPYKIIDEQGNTLAKGYKNKQAAKNDIRHFKLNKRDLPKVEEYD